MRLIKQTFDTVTEEIAAQGDYADCGFVDDIGVEIAPDEFDIEEYEGESIAAVALAVKHLRDNGATMPSSSAYHPGVWYSTPDSEIDYATGESTTYSFHLSGFYAHEELAIYRSITGNYRQ